MKQDLTISEALLAVRAAVRFQCGEANAQSLMDEVNTMLRVFGELPPLNEAEEAQVWERRFARAAAGVSEARRRAEEEAWERVVARAESEEDSERDGFDWDGQ
jgi:hypothetical protein